MDNLTIENLLAGYPRTRPPLSDAHKEKFVEEYKINRSGKGLFYGVIKLMESWHHRQISNLRGPESVLELGAGSINHVPYEPQTTIYDCIEPFHELYEDSPYLHKIRNLYSDIEEVRKDARYQRILSIGVLEHLVDLPSIVARSGLLLTTDGVFQGGIPSEGGFLWGLSWRLSTAIAYRLRTGLDYKTIMQHEHVNTAHEILDVTNYFFNNVKIRRFPFPLHHLSLFTYVEAKNPIHDRCRQFLQQRDRSI